MASSSGLTTPTFDPASMHPRMLAPLVGHRAALQTVLQGLRREAACPHAWIIAGAEGIGKATLAYHLAAHILSLPASSEQSMPDQLTQNAEVKALLQAQTHPDLWVMEGVEGKEFTVEDVRHIRHFMHFTPSIAHKRVVIIDSIEGLNSHGANALLKVLEEPTQNCFLFLISHAYHAVLPTIRSRAVTVTLPPLTGEQAATILARLLPSVPQHTLETLLFWSEASPGVAARIAASPVFAWWQHTLEQVGASDAGAPVWHAALQTLPPLQKEDYLLLFRFIQHMVRLRIHAQCGSAPPLTSRILPAGLLQLAADASIGEGLALEEVVQNAAKGVVELHADAKATLLAVFFALQAYMNPS